MKEFLNLYLETHAKPNFKPTSYDTEKTIIDARIIPELGKIKLQKNYTASDQAILRKFEQKVFC